MRTKLLEVLVVVVLLEHQVLSMMRKMSLVGLLGVVQVSCLALVVRVGLREGLVQVVRKRR